MVLKGATVNNQPLFVVSFGGFGVEWEAGMTILLLTNGEKHLNILTPMSEAKRVYFPCSFLGI